MTFTDCLTDQLARHPAMTPQDVVKLCYQASHGAEHLLHDPAAAWAALEAEYEATPPCDGPLYEPISDSVCRVSLAAWRARGLPLVWLFRLFCASCTVAEDGDARFCAYLERAHELLRAHAPGFSYAEFEEYVKGYTAGGIRAVHHSEAYRRAERPAYRIVSARLCRAIPILERVKDHGEGDAPCVIAIDGRAASGKTTLSEALRIALEGEVIHMDDFFLPPALRSEERFRTPGQNIHHERFCEEILPFVGKREGFAYRIFDCGRMDYHGKRSITDAHYRIVEGSYSLHPIFGDYATLTVFSDVTPAEQTERIRVRNGEEMLARFLSRWIPLEEEYFTHYEIARRCDLTV